MGEGVALRFVRLGLGGGWEEPGGESERTKERRLGGGEMKENDEEVAFIPRLEMLQVNPTVRNNANQSNHPELLGHYRAGLLSVPCLGWHYGPLLQDGLVVPGGNGL